jgi:hypothetical protein
LAISEGCVEISCYNNKIKKITIPNSCKIIVCGEQNELIMPENCMVRIY